MGDIKLEVNCTITQRDFDKFYLYYTKDEFADEIIRQIEANRDKVIKGETIQIKWRNRKK